VIVTAPWGKYLATGRHNDGVSVFVSSYRRPAAAHNPLIVGKCSANYGLNALLKADALERGFAEGIFLAPNGVHLSEGTGMNLCLISRGQIITPDADASCLAGITLDTVAFIAREFIGCDIVCRPITREDLLRADEAFFTGTATEITPITMVDGEEIGRPQPGHAGPRTKRLQELYQAIVTGMADGIPEDWLTLVPSIEIPA